MKKWDVSSQQNKVEYINDNDYDNDEDMWTKEYIGEAYYGPYSLMKLIKYIRKKRKL